jgi:GST-like protein
VKVGIMLEETSLAYEPHRIDIMADESHDPAFLALNPNGKIPAIYDPKGPSGLKTLQFLSVRATAFLDRDQATLARDKALAAIDLTVMREVPCL